jgi:tetratricopeptide (TPR) repeat protein
MPTDPKLVRDHFLAVAELPTAEREAYLTAHFGNDAELRAAVERLLAAHDQPASVLNRPVADGLEQTAAYIPSEQPGAVIAGRYKLLEEIGEGGMGTVWVAEQTQPVRRKVALKLVKAGMDSKTVLSRFEAERQALAVMDHPNIAKVLDGGTTEGGRPFFVMEYVKGVPFTRYCNDARLSVAQRLALFVPVCQAVQHAHQKGIIHRDLKPSNILVCLYDGVAVPKVIDFGLAKAMHQPLTEHTLHTAHGVMMGTPLYMSPEQAEFNNFDVDTRTDIYALGVILYELLTGKTPLEKQRFQKAAWHEMLRVIKEEEPQRPSARLSGSGSLPSVAAQRQLEPVKLTRLVRGELDWIVMKCLEKDRSRRYETANGLARDLERYLHDEIVEARPPSAGYRLRKFVRRNKGRVVAAGLLGAMLFLVIGLIVYGFWWTDRQSAERRRERTMIAARNSDALKATLDRIEAALKGDRIAEAGTLLGQADRQIEEQTTADLRERYGQLEKDERTVRELNDIFEERWMISRSDTRVDNTRAIRRYPALFQQYDLDVGKEPPAQSVEKIRRSLIADALASGMAEWFFVDPKYPGLLAVVDLLDPDPGRAMLRVAVAKGDDARVKEIGKTIEGSRLAPVYAIGLGTRLEYESCLRILKAAWLTHPDSFALALAISSRLSHYTENTWPAIEAVGWARTAVALRPNNPLPRYYLGVALSVSTRTNAEHIVGEPRRSTHIQAVDELRHAIQLAPRFARAYGQLAMILSRDGNPGIIGSSNRNPEALAAAHTAIELDNKNLPGHVVILKDLTAKKDYSEAAKVYRQIARLRLDEEASKLQEETEEAGFMMGGGSVGIPRGLMRAGRPYEAYRFHLEFGEHNDQAYRQTFIPYSFNPASAAALAGTGQGPDAPPPAERPAIRKYALEWMIISLNAWKEQATALPALAASFAGLIGAPFGHGPLLVASALSSGRADVQASTALNRYYVHERMNLWLSDPNLAGVRDDQWLAKLPADEREQWQKFWSEVRSLRDRTAPPEGTWYRFDEFGMGKSPPKP